MVWYGMVLDNSRDMPGNFSFHVYAEISLVRGRNDDLVLFGMIWCDSRESLDIGEIGNVPPPSPVT